MGPLHPRRLQRRRRLDGEHGARERALDLPTVFGPTSPEVKQSSADSDPYKDPETADYIGIGRPLREGCRLVRQRTGPSSTGRPRRSPTAVDDPLPDEPGGYSGYQALFGHRYVAPQLGAGTPQLDPQRLRGHELGQGTSST